MTRILVVDDEPDVIESVRLGFELQWREIDVLGAASGEAALDLVEREHPDLVLLDIGLPDIDGYELATRIRGLPEGASIRLLAVTGYGQPVDQERSRRAGFAAHLVKPVETRRLLAHIARSSPPGAAQPRG
jgi:CheY-like chemotaxis protein